MALLCKNLPSNDRLLRNLDDKSYRNIVADAASQLGFHLVPHQFRHGGPTYDICVGGDKIEDVQIRGRWLALSSCRRYAKPASMLRSIRTLNDAQVARATKMAPTVGDALVSALRDVL